MPAQPHADEPIAGISVALDPRRMSRVALLELARVGAGLSYQDIAERTGIPRARVIRLLQGRYRKPRGAYLRRVLDTCWAGLPAHTVDTDAGEAPSFLLPEEAAALLGMSREELRRVMSRNRDFHAIKIGMQIRIPRATVERYLGGFIANKPKRRPEGLMRDELAAILRVGERVLRTAQAAGLLKTVRGSHQSNGVLIPWDEVERVLAHGTCEVPARRGDFSGRVRPHR